jgi:TonB-dependent SusC/RagA subfamily outer membrane receptor
MKNSTILKICEMMFLFQILFINSSLSQDITVQGYVTDVFNRILMGVSVKSAEFPKEVFTDSMGYYKIEVPVKGKLIFSGPGFTTQKIAIKGKTTIDVSLNFDLTKNNMNTGSDTVKSHQNQSTVIDQELIQRNKELSMADLLRSIAGIQIVYVDHEMKVLIHGTKSLNSNNFALIVLNGFAYTGSLGDLNRDNIESIEVLKDPTELSSWGSRGSNGVVLISTKTSK